MNEMMRWLGERREFLAVDIETTGLHVGRDSIKLCQFGDGTRGYALDYKDWRGACREVIDNYDRPMVAHNLLFDSTLLKADGLVIPQQHAHDTMIMVFLKNPAARMGLKAAASKYVDQRAAAGQGRLEQAMAGGGFTWETVPTDLPAYWQYGVLDTCLTALLAEKLYPETMYSYKDAYELELGVIHCLREAELAGLMTDDDYIHRACRKLGVDLNDLTKQLPEGFNPNSDRQVIQLLEGLGAVLTVRTEKGNISVDKHVLRYLEPSFPIAGVIEDFRSKDRMLNAYLMKFQELEVDGVLRSKTRPVGARTGRMSITDPPLQTLPRGRLVRDAIVAREGHRLVMADFAGMELRAMASFAKEQAMLAAFNRGEDLHDFVCDQIYGAGQWTKPQRNIVKNAQFGKIYGAGVEKFAVTAKIPVNEAEAFLMRYDQLFPGVTAFQQQVINTVMQRAGGKRRGWGYVTLIDGRRLPVEADKSYVGVNYLIQGSTAVSMKHKICELDAVGLGGCFRLAVHDELLYEVPEEHAREAEHIIKRVMPDRTSFPGVTLEIETDVVNRWGEHYRHDYEAYVPTELAPWLAEEAA